MAKSETHDEMIEAICDYKKGWTNLATATRELEELTGLTPDIASSLLSNMKRNKKHNKTSENSSKNNIKA